MDGSSSRIPPAVRNAAMVPEGRPQGHCTPRASIEPAYRVMGAVDLDPASNPSSLVVATRSICWEKERDDAIKLRPGFEWGDGLAEDWSDLRVWLQPNWDDLEPWLERAAFYRRRRAEIFALLPVRTHRNFWKYVWEADAITFLPPLVFVGQEHQMPLPCCYAYWGPHAREFVLWTAPLGQPIADSTRLTPRRVPVTESAQAELATHKMDGAAAFLLKHPELSITQIAELDAELHAHVCAMPLGDLAKFLKGIRTTRTTRRTAATPPPLVSGPQADLPGAGGDEDGAAPDPETPEGGANGAAPRRREGNPLDDYLLGLISDAPKGYIAIAALEEAIFEDPDQQDVSRATIGRALKRLKDREVIVQNGDTRGAEYRKADA